MKKCNAIWIHLLVIVVFGVHTFANDVNAEAKIVINASIGASDGQFGYKVFEDGSWVEPSAIAIDSKGNIYVADPVNNRVQKFSKDGKFIFKIQINVPAKRYAEIINDITVDKDDNLYVLSRHEKAIFIYAQKGNLVKSINYETSIVVDKIAFVDENYIYLYHHVSEKLIKLNKIGGLDNKWDAVTAYFNVDGDLYISGNKGDWRKYDKNGKLIGLTSCEKENIKVYFPVSEGSGCQFPPQFIDRDGKRYYLKIELHPKKLTSVLIFDRASKFIKKITLPFAAELYSKSNLVKFGNDGNFYSVYGHPQSEFQLMRIDLI